MANPNQPNLPTANATQERVLQDLMRVTRDPSRSGRGMASTILEEDEPYRDRERAYRILRISTNSRLNPVPCLDWQALCRHVNLLLRFVSAEGATGDDRRKRIKATRRVLKALHTMTGIRSSGLADQIEQEGANIALDNSSRPVTQQPQADPSVQQLYGNTAPLGSQALRQHLRGLVNATLRNQVREQGIHQRITQSNMNMAHADPVELWRYLATDGFCATIYDGDDEAECRTYVDSDTMSAVATPHDARSLWAALSYCVTGNFDAAMRLKTGVYEFFYEVMNKGDALNAQHSRYRFYQFLERESKARVSAPERDAWGEMSLFRSLARNDPDAGPPGYTRFEQIFWVLADYFGTEVVVFRPPITYDPSRPSGENCNKYEVTVYGEAPGPHGWGRRPASVPQAGAAPLRHPHGPVFKNSEQQILLVTDHMNEYIMPVRYEQGPDDGNDNCKVSIETRHYDDVDRWPSWGQGGLLRRPPNVYLMGDTNANAHAHPFNPLVNNIDPRAWLEWIPHCQLTGPARSLVYRQATNQQLGREWPRPADNMRRFMARVDAEQQALVPEADAVIDSWDTWMANPPLPANPSPLAGYLIRDGPRAPPAEPRYENETQKKLYEYVRKAYLRGMKIPTDPLNGKYKITLDGKVVQPDDYTYP